MFNCIQIIKIKKMKLSDEEKETYNWLKTYGFTYNDIVHLIKLYNEENIKFCIKSFDINDFPDLREYLKKQENSKKVKKIRKQDKMLKREHSCYIDFLLKGIIGVDKERVKRILYNS